MQEAVDNAFLFQTKELRWFEDMRRARRLMTSAILEEMSCHAIRGNINHLGRTNDKKKTTE